MLFNTLLNLSSRLTGRKLNPENLKTQEEKKTDTKTEKTQKIVMVVKY